MGKTSCRKSCWGVLILTAVLGTSPAFADLATFQGLGHLPGGFVSASGASAVSADGSVVVGYSYSGSGQEAFRWTQSAGMVGMGDLGGGGFQSAARDVSADGSVVVGYGSSASGPEAFRWTQAGGMVGLGDLPGGPPSFYSSFYSRAHGVSADGSVVVGQGAGVSGLEAFRWTQGTAMVGLGDLPGGNFESAAYGVSADGSVVVGYGTSASGREPFRWTEGGGMVGLNNLAGGEYALASGVSADGSVVVGMSGSEAFRWTPSGGMVGLGDLPGGNFASAAIGVSADGSVVVGQSQGFTWTEEASIWDEANGMRSLRDLLTNTYGLSLTGWQLISAQDVVLSADGLTIVGAGRNPSGQWEAWRATMPNPVPVPGAALLGVLGLSFAGWRLKRKGAL